MSSKESRKETVIADIRACLVSSGVGLSIYNLERDYRNLLGERIPYRDFGYPSLLLFLKSISQFKISVRNGDAHVEAVASQESKHIADLVKGQKRSKPKSRGFRFLHSKNRYNYAPPCIPRFANNRPSQFHKESQNNSSQYGSKGNGPLSHLPKHTFAGSKPATGNESSMPNPKFVEGKSLMSSQQTLSNHLTGSKPNETSSALRQQTCVTFAGSKPTTGNESSMPNPRFVEGKPPMYSQPTLSNDPPGSKPNATSPLLQRTCVTFAGSKQPTAGNESLKPNPRFVEGKPVMYSQPTQSGSKPSATSPLQQETCFTFTGSVTSSQMPKQNDNAGVKPSVLLSREVQPIIAVAQSKPAEALPQLSKQSFGQSMLNSGPLNVKSQNQSTESSKTGLQYFSSTFKKLPESSKTGLNYGSTFKKSPESAQTMPTLNGNSICRSVNQNSTQPETYFSQNSTPPSQSRKFKVVEHSINTPRYYPSTTSSICYAQNQYAFPTQSLLSWPSKAPVLYSLSTARISPNRHRINSVSPIQSRLDKVRQPSGNQKHPIFHEIHRRRQSDSNAMKTKFLPQLKKPHIDTHWELFVLNFLDFSKVSVRLIGPEYSDKFALLEEKMTTRYIENITTAHQVLPSELIVGSSYAFVDVKNKFVSRVLLQRYFKSEDQVSVVFFDLAEEATVAMDMIYELDDDFTTLAPQSFEVLLEGLEPYKFEEFKAEDFGTDSFCQKSYVAIVSKQEDPCSIMVTLYDTSSDVVLDINETLRNKVACKLLSSFIDKKMLKAQDCIEAFITNIDEMGNIFINIISKSYGCLLERLTDIDTNKNLEIQKVTSLEEIVPWRYYFVSGESPLRAVLDTIISENSVLMEFVDCGQFRIVQVDQLFCVPKFDHVLRDIPHQATMVRLAEVDYSWAPRHQSLFIEIVEIFSKAIIVIKYVRNEFPFVKIVINKNGQEVNVGETMNSMHLERNKTVMKGMYEVDGQFIYKQCNLPKNQYLAVLVPCCENAENISLQLVELIQELRDLTDKLKSHYSVKKPTRPFKEWRVGDPCVVSDCESENYFRGVILQFDSSKFARIRCVDFGYTMIVPIEVVFILDDIFKVTPALAVNAKLAGIEPICGVKNFEATKLMNSYFKEQKKFCAKVVDTNDSNPSFLTYSVLLYDTSQDDDVNFTDLLVESGLAMRAASD